MFELMQTNQENQINHLIGQTMTAGYGSVNILNGCTVEVSGGEFVVIVGPNGAGKSTVMKVLLGLLALRSGSVLHQGININKVPPQQRVSRGIGFVPQTENVFTSMTVEENLQMGAFLYKGDCSSAMDNVYATFPILKEKRKQLVGQLSGGQRQQVAIGRALMSSPTILMLDEPTAGISPIVVDELFEQIEKIKNSGVGILMVEQNVKKALQYSDRAYVLVTGSNFRQGKSSDILADDEVRHAFLGG